MNSDDFNQIKITISQVSQLASTRVFYIWCWIIIRSLRAENHGLFGFNLINNSIGEKDCYRISHYFAIFSVHYPLYISIIIIIQVSRMITESKFTTSVIQQTILYNLILQVRLGTSHHCCTPDILHIQSPYCDTSTGKLATWTTVD